MKEWSHMWGAKVKLRNDMPDDMLRDAIETSRRVLGGISDFDTEGTYAQQRPNKTVKFLMCMLIFRFAMRRGYQERV